MLPFFARKTGTAIIRETAPNKNKISMEGQTEDKEALKTTTFLNACIPYVSGNNR